MPLVDVLIIADADSPLDPMRTLLKREYGIKTTVVRDCEHESLTDIHCVVAGPQLTADGLSTLKNVRERRPSIPVILFYENTETAVRAFDTGVDHCIRYDNNPATQAACVANLLEDARRAEPETMFVRSALDALTDVFFVFTPELEWLYWNQKVNEVTGYSDTEIADITPLDFIAEDDTELVAAGVERVLEEGCAKEQAALVTKDGSHIPYEFTGALLEDWDGTAVGICGVGRDITKRRARERELKRYETIVETAPAGVFVLDNVGTIIGGNERAWRMAGCTADELVGEPFLSLVEAGVVEEQVVDEYIETVRELLSSTGADRGVLEATVTPVGDEERIYLAHIALLPFEDTFEGTVIVFQDITERKRRENALEYQAERLNTLNHVNEVIRDVMQALVRASTREEIEETVCTHLASDKAYRFAWIGKQQAGTDRVEARASAGVEEDYLAERAGIDDMEGEYVTARTAIRTGEMQVAQRIAENPAFEPWREAALSRGYQSAAAVPLRYRETAYGVLCVYSPRPDAFDETEREVLEELGETIAYAISAAEQYRALITDTVLELEFAFHDPAVFSVEATEKVDCTITLDGVVLQSDGSLVEFITVTGASPESILDLAAARDDIDAALVSEGENEFVLRLTSESSNTTELAEYGGIIRRGVAEDGEGRLVIEFPQDSDVRALYEALSRAYPGTELVGQRERERTSTRGAEFRSTLSDALTERQHEVLKTAYLSGFFEWPRDNTGEEIADTFSISTPTFHEHIRTSERKLLRAFFDEQSPGAKFEP
jgi:PAS domain S-box-containing protein